MRIICDATGQTYNRLWAYVTSVARCVAEKTIILYDWTIEDFPHLLHAPLSITRYGSRGSNICLRDGDCINT